MHLTILFFLFASTLAAPNLQHYGLPSSGSGGVFTGGSDGSGRAADISNSIGGSVDVTGGASSSPCGNSQALNADGSCGEAEVTRNIFVFQSPEQPSSRQNNPPPTPKPKLNYNIVFVRTPEGPEGYEPVVVPPAQQKTIVYVLSKDEEDTGPQVIQVPDIQPHAPEVFYINYKDGDNPQLPIGVDLQTALANAVSEQGRLLASGGAGILGGSNFGTISGGAAIGGGAAILGGSNFGTISSGAAIGGGSNFGGISVGAAIGGGSNFGAISGGSGIGISSSLGLGGIAAGGSIGGFINTMGDDGGLSLPNPSTLYGLPHSDKK